MAAGFASFRTSPTTLCLLLFIGAASAGGSATGLLATDLLLDSREALVFSSGAPRATCVVIGIAAGSASFKPLPNLCFLVELRHDCSLSGTLFPCADDGIAVALLPWVCHCCWFVLSFKAEISDLAVEAAAFAIMHFMHC
jgi:hypothetical protein